MTSFIETRHIEAYIAGCAEKAGVRVVWDKENSVPRTDGITMWLPLIKSSDNADSITSLRYFVKHETSHITYTDFDFARKVNPGELLMFVMNLLEDNRIDYLNDMEYVGDARLTNEYVKVYASLIAKATKEQKGAGAYLAPLFAWDAHYREWAHDWVYDIGGPVMAAMDAEGKQRYADLMTGNYGERLVALRTSPKGANVDLLSLAEDIIKNIYKQDPGAMKGKSLSKAGEGKGEGESKGKGKGKVGEGEGKAGEGEGEGEGKDGEGDMEDRIISIEKFVEAMGADHFKPSRTGVHLEHEVSSKRDWAIPSRKDYVIRKLGGERANPYFKSSDVSSIIDGHTKPLSAKLRHKLQVRSKGRYEYGKKEGKLHNGSLHRLVSGRGSEQEKRVFRQHIVSDTLDTAVSLLVDCSGSMQGSKFEMACAAAASVGLALMPLHIPYTILGFTNDDSGRDNPVINVFSQWGEAANQTSLVKRFSEASNYLYQNSDGDGIAWAYSDLMQRKEKRRILIVLSDGSPAGRGWAGDVSGYTKHVIQSIEKGKAASIYGVGIMDNNVKKYYTKNVVINKVESLSSAILSILDKEI